MAEIVKPGFILFCITLIAGLCLGYVQKITEEPIRIQKESSIAASMKQIIEEADSFKDEIESPADSIIQKITTAYKGNEVIGFICEAFPKGYSGKIDVLIGIDTTGTVMGVRIVQHTETPGLGAKAEKEAYTDQYKGKSSTLSVTKYDPKEDEIQGITSATITSKGITNAVNEVIAYFQNNLKGAAAK